MPEETATFEHFQIARREDGSLFELGRGAMGVTYKAYDTRLDGYVALKVINPGYLNDETGRERFLREARAAAHLDHPNVAAIFHRGQEGGNYFYAMQFIEGETVDAFVRRRGALPPALALRIILQAAQGLAAANARGLIHRDIKPANLMLVNLDGGQPNDAADDDLLVKVIDFGLAKVVLDDKGGSELSLTGEGPIGTPYYMSPEQIDSSVGEVDARTDIYSLGVTLWYLLTGQPPFVGTQFQVFRQHISAPPPTARLPAAVPENVRSLLDRMMAKTPTDRPANTRDLIAALRELLRGPLSATVPDPLSSTPPPPRPVDPPLPPSVPSDTRWNSSMDHSATQPIAAPPPNPADTHRPPPMPFAAAPPVPAGFYQPPPVPGGNSGSTFPSAPYQPPPVPGGNSGSTFPPGPYQPPTPAKPRGREWMIFGGVLLGALLLGGIPLGYYVSKSKRDKQAGNESPPAASVSPAASTPPPASVMPTTPPPGITPRRSSASDAAGSSPGPSNPSSSAHTLAVPGQYPSIQAGINAAKSGDTVKVAAGIYREKLVFKDGIRLIGAGMDETIVSTPGDGECLEAKNCASGSVVGFTFEHTGANKPNQMSYVAWLHGSAIRVRECRFRNSGSIGVGCEEKDQSIIENCEVLGSHAIGLRALGAGTAPTFRNNHVHDNGGTNICFVKGAGGTAENNVSEDSAEFGFSVLDPDTAPVITGNTVRANKMSGFTYQSGAGGTATENLVENNREGGIRLSDKGTSPTVTNNHIKGSGLSGFIIVAGAGGVISGNTSEANTGSGFLVSGAGTAPTVTANTVTDNKGDGLFFSDGAHGTADGNTISGNFAGVQASGKGTEPTLHGNQIRNNNGDGILIQEGAAGVLDDNLCENNGRYGISVYGAGTSPVINANNKTQNNKKDNMFVEKGATPKRGGGYDGFFK